MKVCIFTLGCKVNQYESERIKDLLLQSGIEATTELENADVYIINTCAVTNVAEKKSRQAVARVLSFNKNAKIFVMGCASQHDFEQFGNKQNVVACIGNNAKTDVVDLILNAQKSISFDAEKCFNDSFFTNLTDKTAYKCSKIRTHIKIQDGCNNFCSYCLIPYLRGRSRSRSLKSIICEAQVVAKTCKEIVLVGIDLSSFNDEGKNLIALVQLLDSLNVRIRLGSLELSIIDDENLKKLSLCKNFAPHFHLSLQNACNQTLKQMNRHYTIEQYIEKVNLIRKYFENCAITTDIIVGFPTETEQNAKENLDNVAKIGFSKIHIFEFSSRSGTRASKLQNVATNVKERIKMLEKVAKCSELKFLQENVGKQSQVLFEESKDGFLVGLTPNYIKVLVKSERRELINQIVNVKLEKVENDCIIGKIM